MTEGFTAADILQKIPNLTYRQLDHWTTSGRIHANSQQRTGSGHRRTWPADQVRVIERTIKLQDMGFEYDQAWALATDLQRLQTVTYGLAEIAAQLLHEQRIHEPVAR